MRALVVTVLAGCAFHAGTPADQTSGGSPDAPVLRLDGPMPMPMIDAPSVTGDGPPADWWNSAWSSRMQLTITNRAATALPAGYQIGLSLDLDAAPCTGSRDGARIVREGSDLARVIDEVGTDEWTWFPLQSSLAAGATSTEYWLYCGNASPTPAPKDPAAVFDFWEDFPGTTVPAAWTGKGTVSVASGSITISAGDSGIHSNATFGAGVAIDCMATASAAAATSPYWWCGFQQTFSLGAPWVIWHAVGSASAIHPSAYDTASTWNGNSIALDTAPHLYGVENYGDSGAWREADAIVDSHTYATSLAATQLNLRLHNYNSGGTVSFDWARVRKAVHPAPTVTVGSVETW